MKLEAKQRLSSTALHADGMATQLKHLGQKMAEKLGIGLKDCKRLDLDEGALYFDSQIDPKRLNSIPHQGNKYFPDGEDSGYLEIEHWMKDESILYVNVH